VTEIKTKCLSESLRLLSEWRDYLPVVGDPVKGGGKKKNADRLCRSFLFSFQKVLESERTNRKPHRITSLQSVILWWG